MPEIYTAALSVAAIGAMARLPAVAYAWIRTFLARGSLVRFEFGWVEVLTNLEPWLLFGIGGLLFRTIDTPASPPVAYGLLALLGAALVLAGWAFQVWAFLSWTSLFAGHGVVEGQQLITRGAYGVVRHPAYAGVCLVWLGLGIAFASPIAIAAAVLYAIPIYVLYLRAEETMMRESFGDEYMEYARVVPMLVPRLHVGRETARADADSPLGIAAAQWRVLSLRFDRADLARLETRHLVYGLLVTWAVGIGRYWDHPEPYLLQSLGLGSLAVMGCLVLFLHLVLLPLRPARWSLVHLLTFVSLTALPAALYAVPVERFMSLENARTANAWFLAVVALWRVAMLGRYLARWTDLSGAVLVASLLLPLALVVVALTVLNLEQAAFDVMSGLREDGTAGDTAYQYLFLLSMAAFVASPALALIYAFAVWSRRRRSR